MKHTANTLKAAAIAALLLPVSAFGQAAGGSSGSAGTSPGTSDSNPASDSTQYPRSLGSDRSSIGSSSTESSTSGMPRRSRTSSTSKIAKVSEDHLETRLTAEQLIGKSVVDREGNEIGEVKDVGLASVVKQSTQSSTLSGSSTSGDILGSNESLGRPYGQSGAGIGTGQDSMGSISSAGSSSSSSSIRQAEESEVNVYISMKDDDSLLRVPASELSFNELSDQVRLNLSQSDLEQVPDASSSLASSLND